MATARAAWKTSGLLRGVGIPAPSGQYAVGCVDLMHQVGEGEEDVFVRLFYPTANPPGQVDSDKYALWYPHKNYLRGFLEFMRSRKTELKTFIFSLLLSPRVPAVTGSPLYKFPASLRGGDPTFPVMVVSHGLGAMRTTYSGICSDLASHGYVIAAVEHRDLSACMTLRRVPGGPDGELVDEWVEHQHVAPNVKEFPLRNKQVIQRATEASRALDLLGLLNDGGDVLDKLGGTFDFSQFKGRMDLSRPAVMGHSFGGGTTVQTLSQDTRFKCGIALDTWMYPIHNGLFEGGIDQPLLFINSFDFQWEDNVKKMMKLVKPPDESGMSLCRVLTLIDSNHFNQCDALFVLPSSSGGFNRMNSKIDPLVAHQVNLDVCHAFLKRHQLQDPAYQQPIPDLDGLEGHSEHILFGTNLDLSEDDTLSSKL